MKFIAIVLILSSLILSACIQNQTKKENNIGTFSDTLIKGRSELLKTDTFLQDRMTKINELLSLPSIQNGFDGFQIRIWIECNNRDTQSLIVLKENKGKWAGIFYFYKMHWDKTAGFEGNEEVKFELRDIKIEERVPQSGWKRFSDQFIELGVENLPDYRELYPKYNYSTDADGVTIEIGTPKKFKIYGYPALDLNKTIKGGPAQLEKALLLIEKEFDYKRPC